MEEDGRVDLIYFETQTAALCGVHAINTLLQAPHFSEVEMAQIAQDLDAAEHALMATGGLENPDYLQYVAEGSSNVAENGMFSIQVLSRALEVFGLQAVPLSSPEMAATRTDPTTQQAFICNQQEHWLTVRRIHDQYWNLNSIYTAPEPLSSFHLSAFLGSLQQLGYTIFVILGELPPSQPPASVEERAVPGLAGRWFSPDEARAATQEREELKKQSYVQAAAQGVLSKAAEGQGTWVTLHRPGANRALEESGVDGGFQGDDPELARVLAASLDEAGGSGSWPQSRSFCGTPAVADDEDADLAAAIAASQAHSSQPSQQQQEQQQEQQRPASPRSVAAGLDDDEDPELAAAIAASLSQHIEELQEQQEQGPAKLPPVAPALSGMLLPELHREPEAGAQGTVEVALRLPGGGGRVSRRFLSHSDTVGHLAAFAAEHGADMGTCQLALQFPRTVLCDYEQSLEAAGVGDKQLVVVEPELK